MDAAKKAQLPERDGCRTGKGSCHIMKQVQGRTTGEVEEMGRTGDRRAPAAARRHGNRQLAGGRVGWWRLGCGVLLLVLPAFSGLAAEGVVAKDPADLRVFWKDGLHFETVDKSISFRIGGRIMNDLGIFSADDDLVAAVNGVNGINFFDPNLDPASLLKLDSGTEFRRARIFLEGVMGERIDFKAQYDFAGGDADFKDIWIGLRKIPGLGHLKFGHHKEPFSLEENTSSKFITFMERALPSVFAPGRNTGISAHNVRLNQRLTWGLGVFAETDAFGDSASINGGPNITGRITGLPLWRDEGARLIHLGLSVSQKGVPSGSIRFRQRPEAHLLPRFIDTGSMSADSVLLYSAEAAWVDGPFSVQAEYTGASLDSTMLNDPSFGGGYVQASWFLTGEHRKYKRSSGVFDRIHPDRSFIKGGPGAWEVAVRYSMLDLNDQMVQGGQLDDFTLGVNWYLSASTRFMFNYVNSSLSDIGVPDPSNLDAFMMRFQVDF